MMTFSVIYSHAHCEERRFVDFVVAVVRRSHVKLAPVRPAHNDPPRSSHKKDYHKTTPAYIDSKIVEYKTYHDNEVSCWLQQKRRLYEATVFSAVVWSLRENLSLVRLRWQGHTHREGTMYFNWVMSIVMYVFMVNDGRSNSKHFTVQSTFEGVALII